MSQSQTQTGVSSSLATQLKKLNVNNPVTEMLREKQYLELLDRLLQEPDLISKIYGDKIGSVLRAIRTKVESLKEEVAELQFENMMNKYYELRKLVTEVHPMANLTPTDQIRKHIQAREWDQLRDMFAADGSIFWQHVSQDKVGYVIASIRRYAFDVQDDQMHTPEYTQWRQALNALKPKSAK